MKKNIIYISLFAVLCILVKGVLYTSYTSISILVFMILNILLPSVIILILSFLASYNARVTIKKCLIKAVLFAAIALVINLANNAIVGNTITEHYTKNVDEQLMDDLYDDLDKQAREYMIEQGLIDEDEELRSENYKSPVPIEGDEMPEDGALYGEWDVEITSESTLDTITSSLIDILVAFIGGFIAMKVWKKREASL